MIRSGRFGLIEQDCLEALDALQWLRTGEEVCKRFELSQSSVSRKCRRTLAVFEIDLQRIQGEWCTIGDSSLLLLERRVHQHARFQGRRRLRLEATYWSGPLLCTPTPRRWLLGLANIVGVARNFQLVRERIVDAFLAGLPDLPAPDDPDLTAIVLSSMPVFFVARADHPLMGRQDLRFQDIAGYPTLGLNGGAYPLVEKALGAIGLGNDPMRMQRYRRDLWEGRAEKELTIGYGTPLSLEISGGDLVRLPLELPFRSGVALVVRREVATHPELLALQEELLARLAHLASRYPELRLEEPL
jgi:DNA-binding transcriptional LysR family regulator